MKYLLSIILLTGMFLLGSCLEDAPVDPDDLDGCADQRWVQADLNGNPVCYPEVFVSYDNPNSSYSELRFEGQEGPNGSGFYMNVKIPASGLELNRVYKDITGAYFGEEEMISAQLVVLTYEAGVIQGAGTSPAKFTGTFSFVSENSNTKKQNVFTNGTFSQNSNF